MSGSCCETQGSQFIKPFMAISSLIMICTSICSCKAHTAPSRTNHLLCLRAIGTKCSFCTMCVKRHSGLCLRVKLLKDITLLDNVVVTRGKSLPWTSKESIHTHKHTHTQAKLKRHLRENPRSKVILIKNKKTQDSSVCLICPYIFIWLSQYIVYSM